MNEPLVRRVRVRAGTIVSLIIPVHERIDPFGDEELDGIRGAHDGRLDRFAFLRVESGQHVIPQFSTLVATPDADPQPRERFRSEDFDDRPQPVVPT